MTEHDVVIAGGGPTGLMLAAELTLAGVDAVIVERRATQEIVGSRAGGLHSRTLEVLDQRGVADRFISAGQTYPALGYAGIQLDLTDFPTRHNYLLSLWQADIERILAAWVLDELGAPILRSRDVEGCSQHADAVDVALSDGTTLHAAYVVGCDGGRSVIRRGAGIDFPGWDASLSFIIAELEMTEPPPFGMRPEGGGIGPVDPTTPGGPYRGVVREMEVEHAGEPTLDDFRAALVARYGTDFGAHSPAWVSRFTDASRQAASYRAGRVMVAGDAAHIHSPAGGQGLNVGVQDAVNLGWKLGQVVAHGAPEALLDTYHAERHPVGARVLRNTMAQTALSSGDDRHAALKDAVTSWLGMDAPRRQVAGMISGLDVRYDLGGSHPLVGRRMPDLDVHTAQGATTVFALLRDARPLLLNFAAGATPEAAGDQRVRTVNAAYEGAWELPVIGAVTAPAAALVRPDGHVAWVGDVGDATLPDALNAWFGRA